MVKIFYVVERLMLLDRLLKKEETGNAKQLASKLGISRSQLYIEIEELEDLGIEDKCYRECLTLPTKYSK